MAAPAASLARGAVLPESFRTRVPLRFSREVPVANANPDSRLKRIQLVERRRKEACADAHEDEDEAVPGTSGIADNIVDPSEEKAIADAGRGAGPRAATATKYPHQLVDVQKLNRLPSEHVLALAEDLLSLSKDDLTALHRECRKRLSVQPVTKIPGLAARSPFPHPKTFFRGENGMRTLPVAGSVFSPGIFLPPMSLFFGAKAAPSEVPPVAGVDKRRSSGDGDTRAAPAPAAT